MNFLYTKVAAAISSQSSVEESLKHIEDQQAALGRTLDTYEAQTKAILNTQGRQLDLGPANRERDNRCVCFLWLSDGGRRELFSLWLDFSFVAGLVSQIADFAAGCSCSGSFPSCISPQTHGLERSSVRTEILSRSMGGSSPIACPAVPPRPSYPSPSFLLA